jgi:hypothetical protein
MALSPRSVTCTEIFSLRRMPNVRTVYRAGMTSEKRSHHDRLANLEYWTIDWSSPVAPSAVQPQSLPCP